MGVVANAEPVTRAGASAGAVIARKAGEEVRFIDVSNWQSVDIKQDLLSGDILRTNATGQLAILFSDRTQVRLGRNSTLVVKQITAGTNADTVLQLQSGSIWARAERGGPGVQVETPAAAAAIRGTDWTMTVNGSQTSLTVLEGIVNLSNPQGSVDVRQGEGAAATIGQAPRKITIVDSDDREQMLFYLPPREAFDRMPPSAQPVAEMRRNADRINSVPADRRSVEDWVTLAETQLSLEGRVKTKQTLGILQGKRLSPGQTARVTLIHAVLAANEGRYKEAAKLFDEAQGRLDSKRRGIALYGRYYARSLADPSRVEPLPSHVGGPDGAFLKAYAVGFLKDIKSAIKVLADAEKQYPGDPELPAYRGWLAMLLNDRAQMKEAIAKSLSIDPQEPTALEARSHYKSGFESDIEGALADIKAAIAIAPGGSTTWNELGNLQSVRGDERAAEAAFKHAIELDPEDPLSYANLATFYLDLNRVEEAKKLIDAVLERDPGFSIALVARGRYYMQIGETDKAIEDLLAGTVADPSYSQGQLLISAAQYQKGDRVAGEQAADNADRLDKNDPVISALRAAIAIDEYDSHGAIRHAQEYVRRGRARGGEYSSLGANQQAGSTLNSAFRFQGLNSWAEYYSDAVFDPFSGAAYIDQSIRGSVSPFANSFAFGTDIVNNSPNNQGFSSTFQGLLFDPHLVSSKTLGVTILPQPFFETSLGSGINIAGGKVDYVGTADVSAYSNLPFPISFYGNLEWEKVPDSRDIGALSDLNSEIEPLSGDIFLAASPTIHDRVVAYYRHAGSDFSYDALGFDAFFGAPNLLEEKQDNKSINAGIGWSHTIGYKNVLNAALLYNGSQSRNRTRNVVDPAGFNIEIGNAFAKFDIQTYIAAINHTVAFDNLTWRYGIEGGVIRTSTLQNTFDLFTPPFFVRAADASNVNVGRAYVDLLHEITADLKAEYALFGTVLSGDGTDVQRLDPRIGIAWSPTEGHWLRAGYVRNTLDFATPSLAPVGVVGLQPNQISTGEDGRSDTLALRWDAEWSPDFFTALEYQHQKARDLQVSIPLVAIPQTYGEGRIDRASLTANLLLDHGFGLSSSAAFTDSENEDATAATFGRAIPYIPEWSGQVALTWVNEANIKTTLAANYVGDRLSSAGTKLDDYWTLDANLTWEPFGKHMSMELAVYNILDEDIQVDDALPGWGRSFKGTLKVRF